MRLRRVRFTVRRMMGVVAVLAGFLGIGSTWYRWHNWSEHCYWQAREHHVAALLFLWASKAEQIGNHPPQDSERINYIHSYEHYIRMRNKWDRAPSRPWLSVEPDSPEPK
jgi:nitrogen fixation-related uncharacterized protein